MRKLYQRNKRYLSNTGYLFVEKIIRTLVNLVVWVQVVKYLGAEQFGIFSYALSFIFIFDIISSLGLEVVVVRDLIQHKKDKDSILGSVFLLKTFGVFVTVILLFALTHLLSIKPYIRGIMMIMSLRMVFRTLNNIDYYFQSKILSKFTVYAKTFGLASTAVLCLMGVALKLPLVYFAGIIVVESLVTSCMLVAFYKAVHQKFLAWRLDGQIIRRLLKDSGPLVFSGLVVALYMRIDQIMIGKMLSMYDVGQYSLSVRIIEGMYFIPMIVMQSLAVKLHKALDDLKSLRRILAIINIVTYATIALFLLGSRFIELWVGSDYRQAIGYMDWLVINVFFLGLSLPRSAFLVKKRQTKIYFYIQFIGVLINIVLNAVLIRTYHVYGAVIATVATFAFVSVFGNILFKETRVVFYEQMRSLFLWEGLKDVVRVKGKTRASHQVLS